MSRIAFFILLLVTPLIVASSVAETPGTGDSQQLLALLREVQTQQAQIVANQAKIDGKLAEVEESVRQARLFSKRGK